MKPTYNELLTIIEEQRKIIARLEKKIEELEKRNAKLEERLNLNSKNRSSPKSPSTYSIGEPNYSSKSPKSFLDPFSTRS